MKTIKKNIIYFCVLILIGAFYFLYISKIEKKKEEKKILKKKIFILPEDKISYIELKDDGKEIICVRENGEWKIKPQNFEADKQEIKNLLEKILKIEKERDLGTIENPEEFGLKNGNKKITIGSPGAKFSLFIGDESPTESYFYATKDKKNLFLISKWDVKDILEKKVFDLRDKRIIGVEIEKEKITGIEIERGKRKYVLKKEKGYWKILKPLEDLADKSKIEDIISDLKDEKIKSFVEKADMRKTGLAKPSAVLKIFIGNRSYSLTFGNEKDGEIFAKNSLKPYIFTIDKKILEDIPENASELREKDVFTFNKGDVIAIEIKNKKEQFTLIKKDDKWKIEKGKKKISKEKVDDFIDDLLFLQIEDFLKYSPSSLKKMGLENPEIKISAVLPEGKRESIYAGKKGKEKLFCFLPERKVIITLSLDDYKTLNKKIDDFLVVEKEKVKKKK